MTDQEIKRNWELMKSDLYCTKVVLNEAVDIIKYAADLLTPYSYHKIETFLSKMEEKKVVK